jgi:hypothetical protein
MEYQYNKKYNPIGSDGCAFISCGVWAEEIAGATLKAQQVNEAYAFLVKSGDMWWNCFIQDWAEVINMFLSFLGASDLVEYIGWWNDGDSPHFENGYTSDDIDFEILRVKTPWGYHFKTPGFNPYPELTQDTEVNGRRYFKILRY